MVGRDRQRQAIIVLLAVVGSTVILAGAADTRAAAEGEVWTGGETLTPVTVGPNVARCGAFPRYIEARLSGAGVDTEGGPYAVVASGCLDTRENVIADLRARDTYLRTGDALVIAPDDVSLVVDGETCVATNPLPAAFSVAGGTGRYAGATGRGTYTIVLTMPTCLGPQAPTQLWFEGRISTA